MTIAHHHQYLTRKWHLSALIDKSQRKKQNMVPKFSSFNPLYAFVVYYDKYKFQLFDVMNMEYQVLVDELLTSFKKIICFAIFGISDEHAFNSLRLLVLTVSYYEYSNKPNISILWSIIFYFLSFHNSYGLVGITQLMVLLWFMNVAHG